MGSPIGSIPFVALGRGWTLKFGNRQRFRVEEVFGIGFAGAVLRAFPGITPSLIEAGDEAAIAAAMKPEDMKLATIARLFECGIVEPVDEDTFDAILDELGYAEVSTLLGNAFSASAPVAAKDAKPGEAAAGKARPKTRKR